MKLYYLDNSGFVLLTDKAAFVWDCWNFPGDAADALLERGYLQKDMLAEKERVYLCISHVHGDHFNKRIFDYADAAPYTYVIADADVPVPQDIRHALLRPGEVFDDGYARITAWDSTDIGVSFLVEAEGKRIFHAGDLNFWHWREESSEQEIAEAEQLYLQALDAMADSMAAGVELLMFPVDPRMQSDIEAGALMFMRRFAPKLTVPMHFSNLFDRMAEFYDAYGQEYRIWVPARRGDSKSI